MQIHFEQKFKRSSLSFFLVLLIGIALTSGSCRKSVASKSSKRTIAPCKCNKKPLPRTATYKWGAINNNIVGNELKQ
jgi:hypothetical protein